MEATAEYELPRAASAPCAQASTQPSAKPTSMRPCLSTVMSLKSSRLRETLLPPASQTGPRWTGSFGVALTRCHVEPASYVVTTYMYQTPGKGRDCKLPAVVVPRKAKAARVSSPAATSEKTTFLIPAA